MYPIIKQLIANNGDAWSTPESTLEACWAALGAGANGLSLSIYVTKDGELVCTPAAEIIADGATSIAISDLTLEALQAYDAGQTFQSTVLDDHFQPTGERGDDFPWQQQAKDPELKLKERKALFYPSLRQVLELFSRRTNITLVLPGEDYAHWSVLMPALQRLIVRFGLARQIVIIGSYAALSAYREYALSAPCVQLCLDARDALSVHDISQMLTLNCQRCLVTYESIASMTIDERAALFAYANEYDIAWRLSSEIMPYAPTDIAIDTLHEWDCSIEAWHTDGVLPCRQALLPNALIFSEHFSEPDIDQRYWRAGYSHVNSETKIDIADGCLRIRIDEGKAYSGAAAICTLPIHGDFDVEVAFHVNNPHQATTFELAAIGIDPGYHHMNNSDLDSRNVNLTFDVHGAPPYASSERDQNDGFRCGWNNSFNFAKIGDPSSHRKDAEWLASSVNMYNKYGRDVGDGRESNPEGRLRLVRSGAVFNSYYRDRHNAEWVCSGSMLVQNLPIDCYLRLAAKHWHKIDPAPHNLIRFWDFTIYQPQLS